jgi:hypothetical protein
VSPHPVESLSAYLDGELPDAERRGVAAHLAGCPSCARHLRELAAVDALARDLPPPGAPDGYLEALPGRVRRRIRAGRPAVMRAPWLWPLAAGLGIAVLAPIVMQQLRAREGGSPAVAMREPAPPEVRIEDPAVVPERDEAGPPATAVPPVARPRAQARARDPRREAATAAPAEARDAFAPPPPAADAKEDEPAAPRANAATVGAVAGAPAKAAAPPQPEALAARDEERADTAAGVGERGPAASSLKKAESKRPAAPTPGAAEEKDFRDASALPAASADEARRAREAWRRFVSLHAGGPREDEGRVRFIEAAVAVFRLTRDEGDRAIAEREARAYLAVPGAPQAPRVREALHRLDDPR